MLAETLAVLARDTQANSGRKDQGLPCDLGSVFRAKRLLKDERPFAVFTLPESLFLLHHAVQRAGTHP